MVFLKKKFTKCKKCHGNLLPKKDLYSEDWSFICENHNKNNCFEIFIHPDYQDIFKSLKKWQLNEFEAHEYIKIAKNPSNILRCIAFINDLNLVIYKKKTKALFFILKLPFTFAINKLITRLKFKFNFIYQITAISLMAFVFIIFFTFIAYKNTETNHMNAFLNLSSNLHKKKSEHKLETNSTTKIDLTKDSDNDGLTDYEEIKKYKTDPEKSDTDEDGYTDKEEIDGGYDPLTKPQTE